MEKKPIDWDLARKMQAEGKTQKEIAAALGTSQPYVSQKLGKRREKHETQETPAA